MATDPMDTEESAMRAAIAVQPARLREAQCNLRRYLRSRGSKAKSKSSRFMARTSRGNQ